MKILTLALFALSASAQTAPLELRDVLASVATHYPPLLAALQDGDIADAELLEALGRFDTTARLRFDNDSLSYYPNRRADLAVEQPLATQGMTLSSGYRLGDGTFASYNGSLQTRDAGEWRAGLRLPLLRDRALDARRAALQKAELARAAARLSIDQQKLLITQAATRRFWDWAAAARRLSITQALLDIALHRDTLLREQVDAGALPRFDLDDNARIVLQRRSALVEAERALQLAAIDLSLYYRDPNGAPLRPAANQAPAIPLAPTLDPLRLEDDTLAALQRRPELHRLETQRAQNQVDLKLAANQRLPAVDLSATFAQDLGAAINPVSKLATNELKASLLFELPFQRRAATGKLRAAEAKERQYEARSRFLRDQLRAEVQDAYSAVLAARQRAHLLALELEASRKVEDAERARFELGEGTLFVLNLREQATADAALRELAALADTQRAYATYQLTVAEALR